MATAIHIQDNGDKRYGELLLVCEYLGIKTYGSAKNACLQLARQSPEYHETVASRAFQEWVYAQTGAVGTALNTD